MLGRKKYAIIITASNNNNFNVVLPVLFLIFAPYSAIFTNKRVLIRPVSKTPIYMTLIGAIISPSLAQTADLLNRRISSFLTESAESLVGKSIEL